MTYSLSKKHTCFSRYRPSSISRMGYLRICSEDLIVFLAETKSILQMYLDPSTQSLHLSLTPLNREGRFNSICQLCAVNSVPHMSSLSFKKGNPFFLRFHRKIWLTRLRDFQVVHLCIDSIHDWTELDTEDSEESTITST